MSKGVNWDYVRGPSVVRIMISVKGVQAIQVQGVYHQNYDKGS